MRKIFVGFTALLVAATYLLVASFKNHPDANTSKSTTERVESLYKGYVHGLYDAINLSTSGLSATTFEKALSGFHNLKQLGLIGNKNIITIADFDQASTKKRLYIIDLDSKKLLLNTWVSHGKNSGGDTPENFSNINNSNASSLGFYVTGEVYYGQHGKSMRLDGVDDGYNNNARSRSIVVHGAPYVSQASINELGRLGRSQGCPAVSPLVLDQVITNISSHTMLFINKTTDYYHSKYLTEPSTFNLAADTVFARI